MGFMTNRKNLEIQDTRSSRNFKKHVYIYWPIYFPDPHKQTLKN